jgi:PAS domain S-box-containing protein
MARVQKIIDLVQKSIIDFPGGQRERTPVETDEHVSCSPDEPVPRPSSFTIADVPFQDNPTPVNKSILIVEDELISANDLKEILISFGYHVTGIASTGERAVELVDEACPDLILMDINLGSGINGIEAAERILSQVSIPIIYVSAYMNSAMVTRAKVTNPYGYILKPFDIRELRTVIEIAFYRYEQNEQSKKGYDELEQRVAKRTADLKRINDDLRKSEEHYRSLFDSVPVGVYRSSPAGQILHANRELVHILEYPDRESLMAVNVHDIYANPEDRKQWQTIIGRDGRVRNFEVQYRTYDGSTIWVRDSGEATRDDSGRVVYYDGNVEDITERKRAEVGLAESEKRYRAVVEDQTELICRFVPDGTLTFVNDAYCRYFGLDRNDCIGKRHTVVLPSEDNRKMKTHIASLTPAHPFSSIRHRIIMPSGEVRWQRWSDRAIFDEIGAVKEYQSVGRDITDVIQAEEALRETKEYLEKLIQYANAPIIVWNPHLQVIEFNHAFETITGITRDEVIGQNLEVLFPEKSREESLELIQRTSDGLSLETVEIPIRHVSGEIHIILWNSANIVNPDRTIIATIAQGWDITKRRQVEQAHLESEEHYRQLVEMSPDAILILNDSRIMELNSAALTLFGYSSPGQLTGRSFTSLVHPDSLKAFKKWIRWEMDAKIPASTLEQKIVHLNGTILDIEAAAVPITYHGRQAVQVIARDITQRKMLENQVKNHQEILEKQVQDRTIDLLRSNEQLKMEVVERKAMQEELTIASNEKDLLLREIHHRVKNNLQLIIGLIDMTKMRTHEPAITAVLTDIMAKIHTMGFVHTRLYESKRFDKINMKQQVTELVDMTSGFYSHEHCTIDFAIDCDEIYLPVDLAMPCALALNELLSNIHKHAFKGRRSGLVEISSSRKYSKIRMVIRDNGVGLPKGFDIEQSNRLGLKLMRALVEQQLHGSVTITSENGTRVVIEIPLAQEETDHGKSTRS